MKYLIFVLLLSGCGWAERSFTHITGEITYKCSRSGVEYVQSDSGLALHVNNSGKPILCRGEK